MSALEAVFLFATSGPVFYYYYARWECSENVFIEVVSAHWCVDTNKLILTRSTHALCFRSMVTYDKWIYKSNPKFPTPEKVGHRKDTIYKIPPPSLSRCLVPLVLTPSFELHLNVQIRVTDFRQTQDTDIMNEVFRSGTRLYRCWKGCSVPPYVRPYQWSWQSTVTVRWMSVWT